METHRKLSSIEMRCDFSLFFLSCEPRANSETRIRKFSTRRVEICALRSSGDIFIYEERLLDCQAEEGLRGGHVTWTRKWWLSRPCVAGDVELDQVPFSPSLELSQLRPAFTQDFIGESRNHDLTTDVLWSILLCSFTAVAFYSRTVCTPTHHLFPFLACSASSVI